MRFFGFLFLLFSLVGCETPRTHSFFTLDFSAQKPRALISATCQGVTGVYEGGFACEEKEPRVADIFVKIMPVPGRVVFSDGLQKKVYDFNWRESGFWIWKSKRIDTTWAPLDLGELTSIYGDVPVAFDVIGYTKKGVIVNRGVIYHRVCNDRDIPCSELIVDYDCNGEIKNTYVGQLGFCNRMSGSSQKFRLPLASPVYKIKEGAKLFVRGGRSGWTIEHEVSAEEAGVGEFKFIYPKVLDGPELFHFMVLQKEQGVVQEYHTQIIINGFASNWTGIDDPHVFLYGKDREVNVCLPVTADLIEVMDKKTRKVAYEGCVKWDDPIADKLCIFAFDRESGDQTSRCLNERKQYVRIGK